MLEVLPWDPGQTMQMMNAKGTAKDTNQDYQRIYYVFSYSLRASLLQIGYWRYISIYRHLQRNPDNQLYPLFEYFENWCQDENRHGDFVASLLKSQPQVSFNKNMSSS